MDAIIRGVFKIDPDSLDDEQWADVYHQAVYFFLNFQIKSEVVTTTKEK
jgi:hypothetical protein